MENVSLIIADRSYSHYVFFSCWVTCSGLLSDWYQVQGYKDSYSSTFNTSIKDYNTINHQKRETIAALNYEIQHISFISPFLFMQHK